MASNNNVFVNAGFIDDGFFAPVVPIVTVPAIINLGAPGDAVYALPFRALGGSVIDLDLLYGLIGAEERQEDIQPIFALGTREGMIRAFGKEMLREGIQALCVETFATLERIEDIVIEGSPLGPNLFGSVGLTTLPTFSVTLDNSDGVLSQLILRELMMYAPAGIFADVAHTVVSPVITGTVTDIEFESSKVIITGGMSARVTGARSLTPRMNLDQMLGLRTAGEYANPGSETDILPEVFGDWLSTDVGASTSTAVGTPAVLIDTLNLVYCVNARRTDPSPPVVMCNGRIQEPSMYTWNPADNYEGLGIIATLTFRLNFATETVVSVRHAGSVDGSGVPISNPMMMLFTMLTERASWTLQSFDLGICQQTRRDLDVLGYPLHWVWNEEHSIRDWLTEICRHYHCDFVATGNGQLAVILDRTLTALPIVPDYHIPFYEIDDDGSPATAVRMDMHGDDLVNQVTVKGRYNWVEQDTTANYVWNYPHSQSAYQTAYPVELTFRGMQTLDHATLWLHSFGARHGFDPTAISFTLRGLKGLPLIPPRLVTMEWPLWGWSEHLLKITKTIISWETRKVSLACVDCQRELDDSPDLPNTMPSVATRQLRRVYQWLPGAVGDFGNLADAPTNTRNEAANGDFELGDTGQWDLTGGNAAPQWVIIENPSEAHHGRFYARHILGAGNGSAFSLRHRIDPGEWVVTSGFFRQHVGGTNGQVRMQVVIRDRNNVILSQPVGNYIDPTNTYLESVVFAEAPANAYYYEPWMSFKTLCTTGQWRADHVRAVSGTQTEVIAARQGAVVSRNFVINGDFEIGQVLFSLGRNWIITNNPGATANSGIWYAAHLWEGSVLGEDRLSSLTKISVTAGQTFTLQAYGITLNNPNGTARMGVTWINGAGGVIAENATGPIAGPLAAWTLASGAMTVPAGSRYAHVWIGVTNHSGPANSFWAIDDILVYD